MLQGLTLFEQVSIWSVLGISVLGLLYALFLRRQILRDDQGSKEMREVWDAIRAGSDTYLSKQLRTIAPIIFFLTFALFFSVYIVPPSAEAMLRFSGHSESAVRFIIGIGRALAFVMGAVFSLLVGQLGMRMAVQANVRVAQSAKKSFGSALRIAYRAGTVTGILTLTGNNVAMDSFGPIADNANGIAEMAWQGKDDKETHSARRILADLDAVGNTTKAITKGVAIGSAVIASVSLFGSYMVGVSNMQGSMGVAIAERLSTLGIRVFLSPRFSWACL